MIIFRIIERNILKSFVIKMLLLKILNIDVKIKE